MTKGVEIPGVDKAESTLLVLFLPSMDRHSKPIDQSAWEQAALGFLGTCFGGATAFPKGKGVWRDDQQGGKLLFDETIVIHCYTNMEALERNVGPLHQFLTQMLHDANQGAVGFVIDGTYMEIRAPLPAGESTNE